MQYFWLDASVSHLITFAIGVDHSKSQITEGILKACL